MHVDVAKRNRATWLVDHAILIPKLQLNAYIVLRETCPYSHTV